MTRRSSTDRLRPVWARPSTLFRGKRIHLFSSARFAKFLDYPEEAPDNAPVVLRGRLAYACPSENERGNVYFSLATAISKCAVRFDERVGSAFSGGRFRKCSRRKASGIRVGRGRQEVKLRGERSQSPRGHKVTEMNPIGQAAIRASAQPVPYCKSRLFCPDGGLISCYSVCGG
jgi:hypothetical protein